MADERSDCPLCRMEGRRPTGGDMIQTADEMRVTLRALLLREQRTHGWCDMDTNGWLRKFGCAEIIPDPDEAEVVLTQFKAAVRRHLADRYSTIPHNSPGMLIAAELERRLEAGRSDTARHRRERYG